MGTKISELSAASALTGTETMAVVQSGATVSTTVNDLVSTASAIIGKMKGTSGSLTDSVWSGTLAFDTSLQETGSLVDLVNNRLIAPVSGYYQINGRLDVTPSGTASTIALNLRINGGIAEGYSHARETSTGSLTIDINDATFLNANDYIDVEGFLQGSNGTINTVLLSMHAIGGVQPNAITFDVQSVPGQALTSNTWGLVAMATENNDSNNSYNTSTNRFQPTVAGFYQLNGSAYFTAGGTTPFGSIKFEKNGSRVGYASAAPVNNVTVILNLSSIIFFNGSTDYFEFFAFSSGQNATIDNATNVCRLNGFLVR